MSLHLLSSVLLCLALIAVMASPVFAAAPDAVLPKDPAALRQALARLPAQHPRVLATAADFDALKIAVARPGLRHDLYQALYAAAERLLDEPPVARVMTGRRLLHVSRRCLQRVTTLALVARVSGEARFAHRCEQEMLAAAAFSDWNPSHFLDVGEMTAALGVGYDWMYDQLPEASRKTIAQAIIEKGLKPGAATKDFWVTGENNWTQVCHGGLTLGALAVAEADPNLAAETIARAVTNVPRSMHAYEPDGAYPEGPMYWSYGTTYNVLLVEALDKALGGDFGMLENGHGFFESPEYVNEVTGPTGLFYNYADTGDAHREADAAMFWFARRLKRPALAAMDDKLLSAALAKDARRVTGDRMAAFMLLWMGDEPAHAAAAEAEPRAYMGRGVNPIATFRSGWGERATYVAVKGGKGQSAHAHLDAGTFVLDADGVRWAIDLGSQDYNGLEQRGLNLWSSEQDSDRWKIFRWSNLAHNVVTIDGALQRVAGMATIETFHADAGRAVVDLSATFGELARAVRRGVQLLPDGRVLMRDEVAGVAEGRTIRWAMLTNAAVTLDGTTAHLAQDGQTMTVRLLGPEGAAWQVEEVKAPHDYDAPIKNTRRLFCNMKAAGGETVIRTLFTPGSCRATEEPVATPLAQW